MISQIFGIIGDIITSILSAVADIAGNKEMLLLVIILLIFVYGGKKKSKKSGSSGPGGASNHSASSASRQARSQAPGTAARGGSVPPGRKSPF